MCTRSSWFCTAMCWSDFWHWGSHARRSELFPERRNWSPPASQRQQRLQLPQLTNSPTQHTMSTCMSLPCYCPHQYLQGPFQVVHRWWCRKEPLRETHQSCQCTYALAPTPLIRKLKGSVNNVKQVWYADDASGAGKVNRLREWWDQIWFNTLGPKFGYFINTTKPGLSPRRTVSQMQQRHLLRRMWKAICLHVFLKTREPNAHLSPSDQSMNIIKPNTLTLRISK